MGISATAAVLESPAGPFKICPVQIEDPREDEILVRIEACGICHTDAECAQLGPFPVVLGHEACGIVEALGSLALPFAVGERVALSYPSCGSCSPCQNARPFNCRDGLALSLACQRADGSRPVSYRGQPIPSAFFQQSAFATHAVAPARSAVRLPAGCPPSLGAALPCGLQTGAGSILNSLATRPGEQVLVSGVGAVGLAAVMAAAIAGARCIVAVDVNADRLALARQLGATAAIDARSGSVSEQVRAATGGGADVALETSGREAALIAAIDSLAPGGRIGIVTVPDWGQGYRLAIQPLFERFGTLVCIIQGSSVPAQFLPFLLSQHAAGRFPADRLVSEYAFEDINQAFADASTGIAIKPVLRMTGVA